ncbi:ABC transporter ATP-binding protein [Desulforudis sp. 1088]|uniref:ABC transporter ATP-binding protein n=2 Tax=Candidatus Desulforudis TaxID=471826 RepID=UPI0034706C7A
MAEALLSLRGVVKEFTVRGGRGSSVLRAVNEVSLDIFPGETAGLVGESGCGKSTLAYIIMRLEKMTRGEMFFEGRSLAEMSKAQRRALRPMIQTVFQDPQSSLNPRFRVRQIVEEPLRLNGWTDAEKRRERVLGLLARVGLGPEFMDRFPHELSGGQRQRVAVARALCLNPKLMVLDEPTSALDVSVQAQVLNLLRELQAEFGMAYLFISHNLAVVRYLCDRVMVMYLGRLVEIAPTEELFMRPAHPYTEMLLQSIPSLDRNRPLAAASNDEMPSPLNTPPGCGFHPRCPRAVERCRREVPGLSAVSDGRWAACHLALRE